ncbi:nucleoside-diphosphate kinase [Clostridiisalibacter paucivorans]|uniref:nucleoside-diphosphate kinase n=1 Tax=Clostridiisalibacter paucivorans TaxID=408753 RepID=UPI00047D8076|nr:nucleoside-diphosphate kinase [Clostridiisalibacter paucivorans]
MDKTLVLIKPDGVKQKIIGKIISMYEDNNLEILDCKMIIPSNKILEEHYVEHKGKVFYNELMKFMSSGSVVALIVGGENAIDKVRSINGATDPKVANEGTIRKLFGTNVTKNTVHGSANEEDAKRELNIWF